MVEQDLNYDKAKKEIEEILDDLKKPELQIEEVTQKVEQAISLIRYCERSLKKKKATIDRLLEEE